jgi:hypothetical protein
MFAGIQRHLYEVAGRRSPSPLRLSISPSLLFPRTAPQRALLRVTPPLPPCIPAVRLYISRTAMVAQAPQPLTPTPPAALAAHTGACPAAPAPVPSSHAAPPPPAPAAPATSPLDKLSDDEQTELLNLYLAPNLTPGDVAANYSIRVRELIEWINRPDIDQRLQEVERFSANRARRTAAVLQNKSIDVFRAAMDAFLDAEALNPVGSDVRAKSVRLRQSIVATRAAVAILRIAGTLPTPKPRATSPSRATFQVAHPSPSPSRATFQVVDPSPSPSRATFQVADPSPAPSGAPSGATFQFAKPTPSPSEPTSGATFQVAHPSPARDLPARAADLIAQALQNLPAAQSIAAQPPTPAPPASLSTEPSESRPAIAQPSTPDKCAATPPVQSKPASAPSELLRTSPRPAQAPANPPRRRDLALTGPAP